MGWTDSIRPDDDSEAEAWSERTMIHVPSAADWPAAGGPEWVHFLVHHSADEPGHAVSRWPVGTAPIRIGRRAPCELVLNDSEVSSLHCQVCLVGDDVIVTDLGSTNGTFVDGLRVSAEVRLRSGASLQVGRQSIKLEVRDKSELAQTEELGRDLERASRYMQSLLPPPWQAGALRTAWFFQPSSKVGGDGFGYNALDTYRTMLYIIDVSGHGVGAAMHAVAVMNTLRQRALTDTDFADPAAVLARLNAMFQMDDHDGMLFSIWYGVFDARDRSLAFASGGHHPVYLLPAAGGQPQALHTPNLVVGALPDASYRAARVHLDAGDRLYLFSDGVFELVTHDHRPWGLDDFVRLLGQEPTSAVAEPERLFGLVRQLSRPGPLDDDFSILVVTVPTR